MRWLDGETVFNDFLSDVLHGETQIEPRSVSLTASATYEQDQSGDLDFGGGEFMLGNRELIETRKRNPGDDYGWWELSEGPYLLELNETISYSEPFEALLQPHNHLNWNGAYHPALGLTEEDADMRLTLPLTVPDPGISIKENARVSTLRVRIPE